MNPLPVMIVGGGPVGLSAAIALARQGVRSVLVERRSGTTNHPKARAINVRTMELLRQWGAEEHLAPHVLPQEYWRFVWCTNMTGREIAGITNPAGEDSDKSPTLRRIVAQDAVEAALLRTAQTLPAADLRFSTLCRSVARVGTGVEAVIEDLETGELEALTARYLIAADGATSRIRNTLGIEMEGPAALSHQASIYFRADLTPYLRHGPADIYYCTEGIWIAVVDGRERWLGIMRYDPEAGIGREDFTPDFCIERIRSSVGVGDLPVEVINTSFWEMGAQVAARFREGPVLLAGDAAHRMSPTGGFGLNSGVQDAHNLAWKLAAVLAGRADDSLLDTYEVERKPVGSSNAAWSAENARRIWALTDAVAAGSDDQVRSWAKDQENHICSEGRALGFRYSSPAIVPDGAPEPEFSSRIYRPAARPGCRAPHWWLERNGRRISTLDLFETLFVLLTCEGGAVWRAAAAGLEPGLRGYLEVLTVASDGDLGDPSGGWKEHYELAAGGAVLVRPDGHVAWHCAREPENPRAKLNAVMSAVLGWPGSVAASREALSARA